MTSKYEEMCDVATAARKNWIAHRQRCMHTWRLLQWGCFRIVGFQAKGSGTCVGMRRRKNIENQKRGTTSSPVQ